MKFILTYCFCLFAFASVAQQNYLLNIEWIDSEFTKKLKFKDKHSSVVSINEECKQIIYKLRSLGYATASLDSLIQDSLAFKAYVYVGKQFQVAAITNGNVKQKYWRKHKSLIQKNPSLEQVLEFQNNILKEYENNGWAFAQVYLDEVEISGNEAFSSKVFVNKFDSILIDSVVVHGETKTKSKFIQRYLGILKGDVFNQKKINSIANKINQLPYLSETEPSKLYFKPGYVDLHLYLRKQKSNQFNLILGVLPNDQLTNGKKVTITGEGKLHLQNQFGVGEELFAEFRQVKPRTQNLDLELSYPYFLNFPLGIYTKFNLYKNDSIFVDIKPEVGILYQFGGFNQLKIFYKNKTSNILNADTSDIISTGLLPDVLDIRNNQYGLSLELQNLDYVLNPRKGYDIELLGQVGINKIKVNQSIANLISFDGKPIRYQYDSLRLNKVNYTIGFSVSGFIPLRKRWTILLRNESAFYIAKNILTNEKFRIGGYQHLRGFDEEAIYTPYYSIFTTEIRFLLSKNSFFNMFSDIALVEDERYSAGNVDVPIGFGVGVAVETKAGIFNLSYALGKNLDNKIQFRNGKIHFGFVSLF